MTSRSIDCLRLGAVVANQPAVDAREELAAAFIQAGVSVHSFQHTRRPSADGRCGYIAERPSKGVRLKLKQSLQLGNRRGVRCPAALLPLPHRARSSADRPCDRSLGEPSISASLPQRSAEYLALLRRRHRGSNPSSFVMGGRMPDSPPKVETANMKSSLVTCKASLYYGAVPSSFCWEV